MAYPLTLPEQGPLQHSYSSTPAGATPGLPRTVSGEPQAAHTDPILQVFRQSLLQTDG